MDIEQYQREAERTKSEKFYFTALLTKSPIEYSTFVDRPYIDMLHAAIGIATEAGEFLNAFKKLMFYGKPLDEVNLDEEAGDLLWYIAIYCNARKTTIAKLAALNNAKLRHRYPEKFTEEKAENRDLVGERKILEDKKTFSIVCTADNKKYAAFDGSIQLTAWYSSEYYARNRALAMGMTEL